MSVLGPKQFYSRLEWLKETTFHTAIIIFGQKFVPVEIGFRPLWIFRFFTGFISNSFTGPYRALCEGHFHPNQSKKVFFRISIFSVDGVRGSNQHYQKVRLDPKDIPNRWYVHRNDIAENIAMSPNIHKVGTTSWSRMIFEGSNDVRWDCPENFHY